MCRQHWPGICRLVGKNAKKKSAKARAKQERELLHDAATCKFGLHRFPVACFNDCRTCATHALGLMDDQGGADDRAAAELAELENSRRARRRSVARRSSVTDLDLMATAK